MLEQMKQIAQQPWTHIEEAPSDYREWLQSVQGGDDVEQLAYLWKEAYRQDWHLDLIQYPLLKRLYQIAVPNPYLYLHLQAVATHTAWATLEESDGKYLIEAFFFFPDHLLPLYERVLFLIYEGYPLRMLQQSVRDLLEQHPGEVQMQQFQEMLASQTANAKVETPQELMQRRDELYQQEGLHFVERLEPKFKIE